MTRALKTSQPEVLMHEDLNASYEVHHFLIIIIISFFNKKQDNQHNTNQISDKTFELVDFLLIYWIDDQSWKKEDRGTGDYRESNSYEVGLD